MNRAVLALALLLPLFCLGASAEPPRRVVSTSPAMTEIVYTLGRGGSLAAVSDFCKWPEAATGKPRIGGLFDTNTERLLALRPDLVLLTPYHRDLEPRLARAGVEVRTLRIETTEEIFAAVEALGTLLHASEEAATVNRAMRTRVEALREATLPASERPRVLLFLGTEETPLRNAMGVGPDTFLDDMLTLAGGRNILEGSLAQYPQLSIEALIANPPDTVLFLGGDPFTGEEAAREAERAARQRWNARLGYVTDDFPRFIFLRGAHAQIPGPSFIDYTEWLATQLSQKD